MLVVAPGVNTCEKDDGRCRVLDDRQLPPQLGHPQPRVEQVAEKFLLVRRREVLDLAANVRRNLRRHLVFLKVVVTMTVFDASLVLVAGVDRTSFSQQQNGTPKKLCAQYRVGSFEGNQKEAQIQKRFRHFPEISEKLDRMGLAESKYLL